MSTKWTAPGLNKNAAPVDIPEDMKEEPIVVLLYGRNMFGDRIYSYVEIPLRNLQPLRDKLLAKVQFQPSEFGTVVAAGKGEPTQDVKDDIASTHPHTKTYPDPAAMVAALAQPPKVWDEE